MIGKYYLIWGDKIPEKGRFGQSSRLNFTRETEGIRCACNLKNRNGAFTFYKN